ncbi:MAG: hypothetical protein LBL33_08240 [Tannerella sp.]|jgi:hypothetical protein|nr:hypothetical protein [Tannerella sp.]
MNRKKINSAHVGSYIYLTATEFVHQNASNPVDPQSVIWKKKVFDDKEVGQDNHSVVWQINDDGQTVGNGMSVQCKIEKSDEGKYIRFYAMLNDFLTVKQSVVFFVDPLPVPYVRVKSVTGTSESAVGDTVRCQVEYSEPDSRVSQKTRDSVKWMVKIGDEKEERLTVNDKVILGGEISFKVPEEWSGKSVMLMPFLNEHTQKVSCTVTIVGKLIVTTKSGIELFALNGSAHNLSGKITARELYDLGLQWFESDADNYIPLISIHSNITGRNELKHFSWKQIVDFAEIDRWMISYRSGGDGDWKASKKGAAGFLLVTVGGVPYWADAIGQIAFTVDYYTDRLEHTGNKSTARDETIEKGKQFGDGAGLRRDDTNSYDNSVIIRAINWCSMRYNVGGKNWMGTYDLIKADYAPENLSFKK